MPEPATTLRDVELVSAGTFAASTGTTTVTRADLESMLAAAADPDLDNAPIRIGHIDPRFDGEPALGWVRPTRIVETTKAGRRTPTLIGDLVGMPSKLAEAAPTAYRRRSVEIAWKLKAGAKTYGAAIVGIALLGVTAPAVKGLADVLALYSSGQHTPPAGVTEAQIVEGLEGNVTAVAMLTAAAAAGADQATLDAIAAAAGARDTADIPPLPAAPSHDERLGPSPRTRSTPMPRTLTDAELRALIGKEADVDVEATLTAIRSAKEPDPAPPTGDPTTDPTAPPAPSPEHPAQPDHAPPVPRDAPQAQRELVTLSAGTWAEAQKDIAWARDERRRQILDGALTSGRIAPAERPAFAAQLERDEEGTTTLLAGLTPRYPVTAIGAATAPDAAPSDAEWDAFHKTLVGDNLAD